MRNVGLRAGFVAAVLLTGPMVWAQAPSVPAGTATSPSEPSNAVSSKSPSAMTTDSGRVASSMSDPVFVNRAIRNDHGMIDLSKLALEKGSSDKVKQVAQTVVDTHTQMLDQLKQVAQTAGLKFQDSPSAMQQQTYKSLQGMSGAAFDKAYVDAMVRGHRDEIRLFRGESQNGKLEPLMKLSADQLEMMKQHLQELEGLQKGGL